MPIRSTVVDINTAVGPLRVSGRLAVDGPFYGGTSGTVEDVAAREDVRTLAEGIEHAILTVIASHRAGRLLSSDAVDPHGDSNTGTPTPRA